MDTLAFLFAGMRFRRKILAIIKRPVEIKAITRIAQGKPMRGARYKMMRENATPPSPPAVHARPVAKARRLQNQWPIADKLGLKSKEAEIPPKTPKERRNW